MDCKKISTSHSNTLRCRSCASKIIIRKTISQRGKPLNWKGGKPKCFKCGKEISYGSKRCRSCECIHYIKDKPKCLDCGKELINPKAKYCKSHSQKQNRGHNWQGGLTAIKHHCIDCNKQISNNSWHYGSKKCLSCANKGKNNPAFGKMSGTQNPNWQDGKSFEEYGKEFDNALKEQIRFRDKYKCRICGCSQIENGRQLDIHHKDYNKKNNDINNLIALCIRCHRKTSHNRIYWEQHFKTNVRT